MIVVVHGLSCCIACGIFPDQGSDPCLLHWQADSLHTEPPGKPSLCFQVTNTLCMPAKLLQLYLSLCNPTDCSSPGSSCLWDSPGKNTGVGCHFLLQGIEMAQKSNLCPRCQEQIMKCYVISPFFPKCHLHPSLPVLFT